MSRSLLDLTPQEYFGAKLAEIRRDQKRARETKRMGALRGLHQLELDVYDRILDLQGEADAGDGYDDQVAELENVIRLLK